MPHKYFEDQFDDEEVLFVFRKHPIVMRRGLIVCMLAILAGAVAGLFVGFTGDPYFDYFFGIAIGLGAGLILGLPSWIGWFFSVFIVTDKRLIQINQKGLFHRSVVDMGLTQIQMVNYQVAGLAQTLFGFGTIMMQTFVGDLVIHDIHHPAQIQKQLLEVLRGKGVSADPRDLAQEDDA